MKEVEGLPRRYDIKGALGKGATGKVYTAFDSDLGKEVALKVLSGTDPKAHSALKNEFEILSSLNHPSLVKVYDLGFISGDIPYFTMDYIEGTHLKNLLSNKNNIENLPEILDSIFSALAYLHEREILHGDIKPENILTSIVKGKTIRTILLDFGLALKATDEQKVISGTPRYLAPEILTSHSYSVASDFYALGISLIDSLLNIVIPISIKLDDKFYRDVYSALTRRLDSAGLQNPSSFSSFIISLCQKEIEQRPESAKECSLTLSRLARSQEQSTIDLEDIFIDREEELRKIESFIDFEAGQVNTLLLLGQTGCGKKRLMHQAIITAQMRGFITISLADQRYNHDSFSRFIESLGKHMSGNSRKRMESSHQNILESLSRYEEREIISETKDKAPIIFDNIVQYIHQLGQSQPLLLCIPDILRFGADFIRFVNHLVYETGILGSNVRTILSRNTDKGIPKLKLEHFNYIASSARVKKIDVPTFDMSNVSSLTVELFKDNIFSTREIKNILEKTAGIPLYITKILNHLVSSEIIFRDGKRWFLDHKKLAGFDIPNSFAEISKMTYSQFDRGQREILDLIALWEEPVRIEDILSLIEQNSTLAYTNISTLFDDKILVEVDDRIYFSNPSYRSQIVSSISYRKRVRIYRSITNYLIDKEDTNTIRISRYALNGRMLPESIEYGIRAAEAYDSRQEYFNAFDLLSRLYGHVIKDGSDEQQHRVLDRLVRSETTIGYIEEASIHLDILIKGTKDSASRALYLKELASNYDFLANKKKAEKLYKLALEEAEKANEKSLAIEIMIMLGFLLKNRGIEILKEAANKSKKTNLNLYLTALSYISFLFKLSGKIDEMQPMIDEILTLINKEEISIHTRRKVLYILRTISFYQGDYHASFRYINYMMEIAKITSNEIENITILSMLGGQYYVEGKYNQLIETLEKALSLSYKFNLHSFTILILSNLSGAYRKLADYDQAMKVLDEASAIMEERNMKTVDLTNLLKPIQLHMALGECREKYYSSQLKKVMVKASEIDESIITGHLLLTDSEYHFQRLDTARSIKRCSDALSSFRDAADKDDIVDTLAHLCVYEIEKGELASAESHVMEARQIFDEIHCDFLKPYLLFAEGSLARATRDNNAEEILLDALKTSWKMGTRENTWQIQRQLALYYIDLGDNEQAINYYRDSMETIRQITESISDEEIQVSYLSLPFRKRVFDEIKALRGTN